MEGGRWEEGENSGGGAGGSGSSSLLPDAVES